MLIKQTGTIINEVIDDSTISMLKRGEKYKLFKFKFIQKCLKSTTFNYKYLVKMLEEMPQLEIESLHILNDDLGVINKLATRPQFETKQDVFKIVTYNPRTTSSSSNIFTSEVNIWDSWDMDKYEYINLIRIHQIDGDLNIGWETNKIWF